MTPAADLFADAAELPPADRAAFLDHACAGDPALRTRLDALLAAHDAAGDFLERPPVTRPRAGSEEKPGDVLGRYTLVKAVGEGGCGVVYLAEQTAPVRRQVALKVIKLGMDTRSVIARFEAERQALALMDHPDIARVFDAGATDAGRPFFVMEFAAGVPITKFCDDHRLPVAARLELFARVCLALQHAHQKGIVHRDVKPSNILVALRDGVPAPKVIDFGIAKATQGRLTEQTLVTAFDQFIGTPAYMSPEQAEQRDADIDTRSDVYSLGVLLYELLTGRLPCDPGPPARAGVEQIRRLIREVEPARPSLRSATLADAERAEVARRRRAAPHQLASALRGDLDWIVMRCLEKDRDRRYGTAQELADDVRRHLRSEPVLARPPSAGYRLRKFVARNKVACASAAAIAAALLIGTVVSTRQAIRATRAEQVARAERDAANAAGRAEARARADAQRRQEQAEDLLTFMLGDFRTELKKVGRLALLDSVGDKAMAYFAALDPRDLTDTALTRQAKALTQIGETRMDEARYADAAAAFATAYARAAALAARHPRDGDMLFERAQAEYWLGFVARKRGDFATGRAWYTRYRDSALALVVVEGETFRAQRERTSGYHNLAVLDLEDRDLGSAKNGFLAEKASLEGMLAAKPGDTQLQFRLADIASWLGTVAERNGAYPEALEDFSEMSARLEALAPTEPNQARLHSKLADSRIFRGDVLALMGRRTEAVALYADAKALLDRLTAQDIANRQWQVSALNARLQLVNLLLADTDGRSAAPILAEIHHQLERFVEAEPSSPLFARRLASAWRLEARRRMAIGQRDAGDAVARAVKLGETLLKEAQNDDWVAWEFAQGNILAGRIADDQNRPDVATRHWSRALAVLLPRAANSNDWRLLDPAAQALVLLGRASEAQPLIARLRKFGYRPLDPLAASIFDAAPTQNQQP